MWVSSGADRHPDRTQRAWWCPPFDLLSSLSPPFPFDLVYLLFLGVPQWTVGSAQSPPSAGVSLRSFLAFTRLRSFLMCLKARRDVSQSNVSLLDRRLLGIITKKDILKHMAQIANRDPDSILFN